MKAKEILDFRFWIFDYVANPKSKIQNPKFVSQDALP